MAPQISYGEDGFVRGFAYHDGSLDGVLAAEEGKVIHLAFRSSQGESRILTLLAVREFHLNEFRQGNTILDMRVLPASRIQEVPLPSPVNSGDVDHHMVSPEDLVFHLTTSYGAEIVAICGDVTVSEIGAGLALSGL